MTERELSQNEIIRTADGETFEVWRKCLVLRRSELRTQIEGIEQKQAFRLGQWFAAGYGDIAGVMLGYFTQNISQ